MAQPPVKTDNLPAMQSGGRVAAIVPSNWQEVVQIASMICRANMAPKSYMDKNGQAVTDKVAVAIMHGLEVGFTPMAALQSIAVINGTPSVYGDGLLALIRASGLLEDIEETMEWAKDGPLSATCKMWRKGEKTPSIQTYTRADAQNARLWGKTGPWTDHPARMLQWRARGWCGRDKFADVLRGLRLAEEVADMVDITPVGSATVSSVEPKREDYPSQPDAKTPHRAPPAEGGQPDVSPPVAGGDSKPEAASAPAVDTEQAAPQAEPEKQKVTDVEDQNEAQAADAPVVVFEDYKRVGDFFSFADTWIEDPKRTEAELIAFSAFYQKYITERLDPNYKSSGVHNAMKDTKGLWDAALKRAQAKK